MEKPTGREKILDLYYAYWIHSNQNVDVSGNVEETAGQEIKVV